MTNISPIRPEFYGLPRRSQSTGPRLQAQAARADAFVVARPALQRSPSHNALAEILTPPAAPSTTAPPPREYVVQAQRGVALLERMDALNEAGNLGEFSVRCTEASGELTPHVTSERLDGYMGVIRAYSRYCEILANPNERLTFLDNNGVEALQQATEGVQAGILHAFLEVQQFYTRVCQVASNMASRAFVDRALADGRLDRKSPMMNAYFEVQADPLYAQLAEHIAPVNKRALELGLEPQMVWMLWAQTGRSRCENLGLSST